MYGDSSAHMEIRSSPRVMLWTNDKQVVPSPFAQPANMLYIKYCESTVNVIGYIFRTRLCFPWERYENASDWIEQRLIMTLRCVLHITDMNDDIRFCGYHKINWI